MQPVIDQVPRSCKQFYSDGLNTYATLLYYDGKHEALPKVCSQIGCGLVQ
jgi:hypothetical protein